MAVATVVEWPSMSGGGRGGAVRILVLGGSSGCWLPTVPPAVWLARSTGGGGGVGAMQVQDAELEGLLVSSSIRDILMLFYLGKYLHSAVPVFLSKWLLKTQGIKTPNS